MLTYTKKMDGYPGEKKNALKKNPCPDCDFCQCCSDTRCRVCRQAAGKKCKKDIGSKGKVHKPLFRSF